MTLSALVWFRDSVYKLISCCYLFQGITNTVLVTTTEYLTRSPGTVTVLAGQGRLQGLLQSSYITHVLKFKTSRLYENSDFRYADPLHWFIFPRYVDNWSTHNHMIFNNNAPTIPQGLEMMSPESPPQGMREEEGAWDTDEFSDGEEATSHQTFSPSIYKQVTNLHLFQCISGTMYFEFCYEYLRDSQTTFTCRYLTYIEQMLN